MVDCATEISPIALVQRSTKDAISWPPPPEDWPNHLSDAAQHPDSAITAKPSNSVHIWAASLQVSSEALARHAAWLAPDEKARAARFRFPIHRDRFIAGRGLLRNLLGTYLGIEPGSLEFTYGPHGKPALAASAPSLHFNVAHSEDLVLIAVTPNGIVGVDVEQIRSLPDFQELVARFFSPHESSRFRSLPPEQKAAAFFNLWTRKEAWLKATGEGITDLLNQVEVSFLPSEPAGLVQLPQAYRNTMPWSLYELAPKPGFTGALAIAGDASAIRCWRCLPC